MLERVCGDPYAEGTKLALSRDKVELLMKMMVDYVYAKDLREAQTNQRAQVNGIV